MGGGDLLPDSPDPNSSSGSLASGWSLGDQPLGKEPVDSGCETSEPNCNRATNRARNRRPVFTAVLFIFKRSHAKSYLLMSSVGVCFFAIKDAWEANNQGSMHGCSIVFMDQSRSCFGWLLTYIYMQLKIHKFVRFSLFSWTYIYLCEDVIHRQLWLKRKVRWTVCLYCDGYRDKNAQQQQWRGICQGKVLKNILIDDVTHVVLLCEIIALIKADQFLSRSSWIIWSSISFALLNELVSSPLLRFIWRFTTHK